MLDASTPEFFSDFTPGLILNYTRLLLIADELLQLNCYQTLPSRY